MKVLFIIIVLLGVYIAYVGFDVHRRLAIGRELSTRAIPFEMLSNSEKKKTMLVVGDSTAVGVGAESSESIPARLAEFAQMTHVENYAKSGATIADILAQIEHAERVQYDLVLLQVGANDILQLHTAQYAKTALEPVVKLLLEKTDRLVHMSAGDVGAATVIPVGFRHFFHTRTLQYHRVFEDLAITHDYIYVNLYENPETDPFSKEPTIYLAEDGLHPTGAGYALWFDRLVSVLRQKYNL